MAQLSDDCFAFGGTLLPIEAAWRMIRERVGCVAAIERVPLREAAGRILAEPAVAALDLPGFANSAVDGYAVRFQDLDPEGETRLALIDRVAAGHRPGRAVGPGAATRIFTGAILPEGADTVLMQEDCHAEGGGVLVRPGIGRGANRRLAGEDVAIGETALEAGTRLGAAEIGLLAALGLAEPPVRRRLRAALFSTGDELREPADALAPGQIHDANRYMVAAILDRWGVTVEDGGILPDRAGPLADALVEAATRHDLIVTSGGVSAGEEDHVRAAIAAQGSLFFWRLAIKPGRPVALGQVGATPLVGLPGNPVAAFLTCAVVARTLIDALAGARPQEWRRFRVLADFAYAKRAGRREYVRASLASSDGGLPKAHRFAKEGAGMLTSLTATDGMVELPEAITRIEPGTEVDFVPYGEMI